jgi:hypothetical protein
MKRGQGALGVGLTMLAIAMGVAACEHEAERQAAAVARPAYFESAATRPSPTFQKVRAISRPEATRAPFDRTKPSDDDAPRAGKTDRFLWADHADVVLDGGPLEDAGPDIDASPDVDAGAAPE